MNERPRRPIFRLSHSAALDHFMEAMSGSFPEDSGSPIIVCFAVNADGDTLGKDEEDSNPFGDSSTLILLNGSCLSFPVDETGGE